MIFSIIIWINMILDRAGTALTVIGWIQFGLLTLLISIPLLLLFIVLIVPFRYDLKGVLCEAKEFKGDETESKEEASGPDDTVKKMILEWVYKVTDPIEGTGKFSWFLGLVKGEMFYKDREFSWKGKIFFKKIGSEKLGLQEESKSREEGIDSVIQEESKSREESKSKEESKEKSIDIAIQERRKREKESIDPATQDKVSLSQKTEGLDKDKVKNKDKNKEKEADTNTKNDEYKEEREWKEDDKSILEKIQEFFQRMSEGFESLTEKIEYTYERICDKIDLALEMKEKISNFINYEIHQDAYNKLKKELKKLWAAVKPTKIKGKVKVGFENPMTTGFVVAGVSLIHPYTNGNAQIEADFDEPVLEGELRIKGKLRLGSVAWFALKMLINRSVQITIKNAIRFVRKNMNIIRKESVKET